MAGKVNVAAEAEPRQEGNKKPAASSFQTSAKLVISRMLILTEIPSLPYCSHPTRMYRVFFQHKKTKSDSPLGVDFSGDNAYRRQAWRLQP
jgi:hypothetical protein